MRGVQEVREIFDGHLVELRCTGVAALPLHLLIYIHGVLGTVAITPQQIPPQFTHTTLYTHSPHAHALTRTRTRTQPHTHAQDEHTHTPHALPLCRWHCCHHPQIYLHPHRHRTRTHAHGTRTHTRCHSASLPLHLYLRRWHRCRHPQIAALEDDSPHVPKAVYSPEVPVAAYT